MKKVFIVMAILVLSITIIAFNIRPKTTTQIGDNEIIGGYANIYHTGERLLGRQAFDIDGKSIESVTGLTFDVWRDQVMKEIKFNY